MKKLLVLGLAALSVVGLRAQDAPSTTPPPDAPSKPLPPLEQAAGRDRGPRPWMRERDRPGMPGDRRVMIRDRREGKPGPEAAKDRPQKPGDGQMLAKALNLTEEQQQKAKAIMEATKPKIEAIREEGREKVKAVISDALNELRPSLTPEQQAVLDDLQKLRADRAALKPVDKGDKPAKEPKAKKEKD